MTLHNLDQMTSCGCCEALYNESDIAVTLYNENKNREVGVCKPCFYLIFDLLISDTMEEANTIWDRGKTRASMIVEKLTSWRR